MSWHFSRALVAEYSRANCSDGDASALLSTNPTARLFLPSDRMTAFSRLSRFGMTFAPLTDALGTAALTWFLAGFPVRTSVQPGEAAESKASDPASGWKWPESSTKYDPDSRTWRTRQCSLLEGSDEFLETWPRWGSMRNGECWEQPTLEPRISATESGSWPTPAARDSKGANSIKHLEKERGHHDQLANRVVMVERGMWPTPNVPNGGRSVAHVDEWSESGRTAYHKGKKVQVCLESAVKLWATPTVNGNHNRKGSSKKAGDGLATQTGGQLNPTWVEWLMGWPLGWTALKPLATGKSRSALPKRGVA